MKKIITIVLLCGLINHLNASNMEKDNNNLSPRQEKIVTISAYAASGNLDKLKTELVAGLDAGLTVNEIKEVIAHLYAYCGFPRSLQANGTFAAVMQERQEKGIQDEAGRESSPITDTRSRYDRGEEAQMKVTGQSAGQLKAAFAFNPIMDVFLKEHLFADLFDRDVLSYQDREIVTVSALASMDGVEPMVASHVNGALNVGVTESQLNRLFDIIGTRISKEKAGTGKDILRKAVEARK